MATSGRKRRRHHHPPPEAVDQRASAAALRAVGAFEALKGILVLLLAFGLLSLLHKDVEDMAEGLLIHLHISPEHKLGHAVLNAASNMTDRRVWALAAAAVAYSTVRFVEAWGLWNRRVWAEWFALLSGALYLPWEILKLAQKTTWIHLLVFAGNVAILLYMLYVRMRALYGPAPRDAAED